MAGLAGNPWGGAQVPPGTCFRYHGSIRYFQARPCAALLQRGCGTIRFLTQCGEAATETKIDYEYDYEHEHE